MKLGKAHWPQQGQQAAYSESVAEKEWGKLHQDEHLKRGIAEEDWKALGNQWRKPWPACRESSSRSGLPDTLEACAGKAGKGNVGAGAM